MGRSTEESLALLPEMTQKAGECSYHFMASNNIQYRAGCISKDSKTTTDFKCMDNLSLPSAANCNYMLNSGWDTAKAYDCISFCFVTDHEVSKQDADTIANSLVASATAKLPKVSATPVSSPPSNAGLSLYPSANLSLIALLLFMIMMFKRTH